MSTTEIKEKPSNWFSQHWFKILLALSVFFNIILISSKERFEISNGDFVFLTTTLIIVVIGIYIFVRQRRKLGFEEYKELVMKAERERGLYVDLPNLQCYTFGGITLLYNPTGAWMYGFEGARMVFRLHQNFYGFLNLVERLGIGKEIMREVAKRKAEDELLERTSLTGISADDE